jgi:acetylornithine deacetylase/succinyl-diaminopimelate desuccinylase-like protein
MTADPSLRDEVLALARDLIQIDTSNPPGRETAAATVLAGYLREAGVECELAGPDPERLNLIARVEGGDGPSLMLMGHTDVVPAPRANWTVDPFAAVVRDGLLIGRGAADMKNELAARAVALARLAHSGARPAGDVVLVAEADEERNTAEVGMSWLVRERPDLRCDFALNEGGGELLELANGRRVVTVSIGEKQVTSLRIRVFGRAGHASVPAGAENPLAHLAAALERLLASQPPARVPDALARALAPLGAPVESADAAVAWAGEQHPLLGELVPAMTRMTVTPTGVQTYEPANVIPPFADVVCDCRALPGQSQAEITDHVERAIGASFRFELEFLEALEGGTESPLDTELYRAIERYVRERIPGASPLPVVSTGFTDSHWVRSAFGTRAYGFAPVFATGWEVYRGGVHGADESLAVDDLAEMAEFHMRMIAALT